MKLKKSSNSLSLWTLVGLLISPIASSENILDIYNEALENDPTYRAAEYSYLADKEIVVQGRAGLLPNVSTFFIMIYLFLSFYALLRYWATKLDLPNSNKPCSSSKCS